MFLFIFPIHLKTSFKSKFHNFLNKSSNFFFVEKEKEKKRVFLNQKEEMKINWKNIPSTSFNLMEDQKMFQRVVNSCTKEN